MSDLRPKVTERQLTRMEEIRKLLGFTQAQMSTALGFVTGHAYSPSRKDMTVTAYLAAEGLLATKQVTQVASEPPPASFMITIKGKKISGMEVQGVQEISIAGQDFIVVPKDG